VHIIKVAMNVRIAVNSKIVKGQNHINGSILVIFKENDTFIYTSLYKRNLLR
jgi:hypothetical protein